MQKQAQIIACLVEGNSMRATSRLVGCSINTVTKLLVDAGQACNKYQHNHMRNLPCKRIQCDEIWAFCYSKEKNVAPENKGVLGYGDVWTWTALCPDTKLIVSYLIGRRDAQCAKAFIEDLAARLTHRIELNTDGNKMYIDAVENAFGGDIDYAMLVKLYDTSSYGFTGKYSPPGQSHIVPRSISGTPNLSEASTNLVERQNLTMRMSMRRFTRLTNGFSKKVENLEHAISLHFMYYNFARIHKTLRITPAMEAKLTDYVWSIEDILGLI